MNEFINRLEGYGATDVSVGTILEPGSDLIGVTGGGLEQYQVVIGNRRWLALNNFNLTDEINDNITSSEETGKTVVLVGINGM